jgi:HK97 family phage prohead protease
MIARKNIGLNDVELKFADNGGFKGYASVFGGVDSYDDTILAGAYKGVIDKIQNGGAQMPKMFVNHRSWDIPVGKYSYIEEDEKGLYVEGEFTRGNPQADIVKAALQHGTVDGLSIGFMIGDYEMIDKDGSKIRVIKSVKELPEISIVTYPADESARVDLTSVKSTLENINSVKDLEDFLREVGGFSKSLAMATVSRSKRIFTLGEPVVDTVDLPTDVKQIIALNLLNARALEILK